jgi:putative transposase
MLMEHKTLSKLYWGRHLWGMGYFVATSGNITDEIIMEYINNQEDKDTDEDFSIAQS